MKENTCHNITEKNPVDDFVCSNCGLHLHDWVRIINNEDWHEFEVKYCPNCGAKVED